jgi:glc operon protein GlcG
MRTKTVLTAADAHTIMTACKAEAAAQKWNVSIAVVDDAGYLLLLERMDGAGVQSPEIATRKAKTSALSRMTTKVLEDMVKDRPSFLLMPDRLPLQGGIPVIHEGETVGAIGVSGVKSHEDEQVAEAGHKALLGK